MNSKALQQIVILTIMCAFIIWVLDAFVNKPSQGATKTTEQYLMKIVPTDQAMASVEAYATKIQNGQSVEGDFHPINPHGFYSVDQTLLLYKKVHTEPSDQPYSIIEIPDTTLAYVTAWIITPEKIQNQKSGMRISIADRHTFDSSNVFKIPYSQSPTSVLITVSTDGPLELNIIESSAKDWSKAQSFRKIWYGIFIGIMWILITYNFLHAIYLKTHSYYYYCIYLLGNLVLITTHSGITKLLLWPEIGYLDTQIMYVAMAVTTWSGLGFCISFLRVNRLSKSYYFTGIFLIFASVMTSLLNVMGVLPALMMQIYYAINFFALVYYLVVPLYAYNRGFEYAKYLFYGFGIYSITLAYSMLKTIGVVDNNTPTQDILSAGILIENFFLSIALYERIRRIKLKQEFAERKLRIANSNFARSLLANQERDRVEISAFLHDAIGHDVLVLKQLINKMANENEDVTINFNNLIDKIRNLSINIHPHVLSNLGLTAAIRQLVNNALKYSDAQYDLTIKIDEPSFSDHINISIYRIIQEALNNILKYANAKVVTIKLTDTSDQISCIIKDDGIGMLDSGVIKSGEGSGLTIIKGRIKLLDGTFEIESSLNQGTEIRFTIPKNQSEETI